MGTDETRLIVVRGNSGSGKSTIARAIRSAYGRGVAWVSQDILRRVVLRVHDTPGNPAIGLIDLAARHALDHGYHVVLDGILSAERYGTMLAGLHADHRGVSLFYYLDVSFDETARRHATRPEASEFTVTQMREWYERRDLLPSVAERVVDESTSLADTVALILAESALLDLRAAAER